MKLSTTAIAFAAATAAATLVASPARATVLASDTFTYPDGVLTAVSGGAWTAHSGTGSVPVMVSGGTISTVQGSGSREDVNTPLGVTQGAGDTFYGGFDVTVSGGSTATYFAHFKDDGTGFNGRIFVAPPTAGGDYTFGISDVASSPDVTFATDFSFGTTYRPVVAYNYDTGISTLTVGGASISSTTADPSQTMTQFAFRQAAGNSVEVIDNLITATTFAEALGGTTPAVPEPTAMAVLGLGGLTLLRRRRA